MDLVDAEVLATLRDDVLHPRVIARAVALALDDLRPDRVAERQDALADGLVRLDEECRRLADAIARGGPLDALVDRLQTCQAQRDALRADLGVAPVSPPAGLDKAIRAKVEDWRALLTENVERGRQVLRVLFVDPFRFTPVVDDRRRGSGLPGRSRSTASCPDSSTCPLLWCPRRTCRHVRAIVRKRRLDQ
jgi:hypothetical protein